MTTSAACHLPFVPLSSLIKITVYFYCVLISSTREHALAREPIEFVTKLQVQEERYLLTTGIPPVSALVRWPPLLIPDEFLGSFNLCYRPEPLDVQADESHCHR